MRAWWAGLALASCVSPAWANDNSGAVNLPTIVAVVGFLGSVLAIWKTWTTIANDRRAQGERDGRLSETIESFKRHLERLEDNHDALANRFSRVQDADQRLKEHDQRFAALITEQATLRDALTRLTGLVETMHNQLGRLPHIDDTVTRLEERFSALRERLEQGRRN